MKKVMMDRMISATQPYTHHLPVRPMARKEEEEEETSVDRTK
jgi:hypothetical protein